MNTYHDLIKYLQPRKFSEGGDTAGGGSDGGGSDGSDGSDSSSGGFGPYGGAGYGSATAGYTTGSSENRTNSSGGYGARANEIADQLRIDPMDALMAATNGFGTMSKTEKGDNREVSQAGLNYGELRQLARLGYGSTMGVNPNNPTQSASEALGARAVGDYIGKNVGTVMGALTGNPVIGTAINAATDVASGVSLGDALANAVVGSVAPALSRTLGVSVPAAAVSQALRGNLPGAVQSTITANIARSLNIPASSVTAALKGDLGAATAQAATSIATRELTQNPIARAALTKALGSPGKGFAAGGAVGDNVANTLLAMGTPSADLVAYLNKRG